MTYLDNECRIWRVDRETLDIIIRKYPHGQFHPDGVCYSIRITEGMEKGHISIKWFIKSKYHDYAKSLINGVGEEE